MILSTLAPGVAGYDGARTSRFFRELVERVSALPTVESATIARHMPLNSLFGGGATLRVRIPGHDTPDGEPLRLPFNLVDENYFRTMGTRIVRGRAFAPSDRWPGTGAALINETMARRYWPDSDPIGRWIELTERSQPERRRCEIVGIVEDGKYVVMSEDRAPYVYLPFGQQAAGEMTVIMRTRGSEAAAMQDFRNALRAIDPSMPAMQIVTLDEHMNLALMFERLAAILVGTLGVLALVLALVGLYGVIAYVASRRTREIGIRMALGARPADVLTQILKQGGGFAATGIAFGLLLGGSAAQLIRSMLYGVSSYDPLTYAVTVTLVLGVALAASYFPARRAARVDPIQALRCE
jgi:predicted permease